jgi:hypothetical protein
MKKLRFLGIVVGVMMMWVVSPKISFGEETLISGGEPAKSCYKVKEYIVGPRVGFGSGSDGAHRFTYTERMVDEVRDSGSFCGIKVAGRDGSDYYVATINKCENGEIVPDVSTCSESDVCASAAGVATCTNKKLCIYGTQGNYYDDSVFGNPTLVGMGAMFEFTLNGEKACFIDESGASVIKRCELETGTWKATGEVCSSKQSCIMHKASKNAAMNAYCESDCSNPDGKNGDAICVQESGGSKVKKCDNSKWTEVSLSDYFKDSSCFSCVQSVSGPTCVKVEDDGQYTTTCNQIKIDVNKTETTNNGAVGDYICDSSGTFLYRCDKGATDGFYTFVKDCSKESGGLVKCGVKEGSDVAMCISKSDFENNDQSVVTSQVTIEVETDSGFFCDGNNGIQTALGCIPYSMSGLAGKLLPLLFGIAGGISFLLMVFGFIMVATSSGDEKKLIEARGRITSAITGLLVSIFAIFLFRLIFSNILKIPGL